MRWSRFVQRHRIAAAVTGVAVLLLLAAPFLTTKFGFPDAGNDAAGTSGRTAYSLTAKAFGPGANGPLLVVAELPAGASPGTAQDLSARLRTVPGVASVTPAQLNQAGDTAVVTVVPTTGPQSQATEDLVRDLRDSVLPAATAGTGMTVHVGGVTATSIDITANITKRIPLLIGGVVLLSMLLLLVSFRSVVVAVKAAVMNLLSVAAAYGVVALVLQGGWFGRLFGIDNPTPLPAFVPVLMFAVLFGLSMDYEVFLVARMREAWLRTGDNATAIVQGLAGTARVITAAAAIMIAVFAAFIPSPTLVLKVIGIGMASAILIDATIVRMLLVPAVMHLMGALNWWMPAWLEALVPQVHVEGHPQRYLPGGRSMAAEPVAAPA
jgi:RND superfamily putative drug exporter